jgi:hypothetical protein
VALDAISERNIMSTSLPEVREPEVREEGQSMEFKKKSEFD